jgi:hypothetical protein
MTTPDKKSHIDMPALRRQALRVPPFGGYILLAFALLVAIVGWVSSTASSSQSAVYQLDRTFLTSLHPNEILQIKVGEHCELPQRVFSAFIQAVRHLEPFQVNHDLGRELGVLTITLISGEEHSFLLSTHNNGIVITFYRSDSKGLQQSVPSSYTVYGYVLSRSLPAILQKDNMSCSS